MTAAPNILTSRTVPLSELVIEIEGLWSNPREFTGLEDDKLEELGKSIKANGIVDPPTVQKVKLKDRIVDLVIDGQRRVLGGREVLPKNAPIPVVDLTAEPIELTPENIDRLILLSLTSLERENLSSYELSTVAQRMKDRGKTLDYIGNAIHRDASWVSKMLKARSTATPKLMNQWRKGQVTDEQFKELAAVADQELQARHTEEVVNTRKSGDRTEARIRSKEIAASTKGEKATPKDAGKGAPVVRGPQTDLLDKFGQPVGKADQDDKADKKPEPPKMRSRAVLDDMLHMADKRPPTADYVKGILDGVRYAAGILEADDFSKAWHQYLSRVTDGPKPKAKPKKSAKAKAAPKAKKIAKPAKKSKAKKK